MTVPLASRCSEAVDHVGIEPACPARHDQARANEEQHCRARRSTTCVAGSDEHAGKLLDGVGRVRCDGECKSGRRKSGR